MTQTFPISLFKNKRDNTPRPAERTWLQVCDNFRKPVVRFEKDGPLFSPATFDPPRRSKSNAKRLSMVVLDIDHGSDLQALKEGLSSLASAYLVSSTHSHLRETDSNPHAEPRFRVVVPLSEPIPAENFPKLWLHIRQVTTLPLDEAAKDVSRIFYTPAVAEPGAPYEYYLFEGPTFDWRSLRLEASKATDRAASVCTLDGAGIANGSRNQSLFKIGKKLANSGVSPSAVRAALIAENDLNCRPPLALAEVEAIASNAMVYPLEMNDRPEPGPPIPLPDQNVPVPALSEMLLPVAWRGWLSDISERLQCPLDYAAVSALVGAASLIGNRIRIRPKRLDSWLVVPNLWGAIVGPPGVMKTPAVNEGLVFFKAIADRERRTFQDRLKDAEFEKEFNDAKRAELIRDMKKASAEKKSDFRLRFDALAAEQPVEKCLWTSDSTIEKLGVLLNENPDGLLILRDELTGWFKQLERPGHEQDRAFYLEAWNGEGAFSFDRVGRGKVYIRNLTVSILGTIQPAMLESYIKGSVEGWGDDGLIQRFQLLVQPETPKTFLYKDQPPKGREAAIRSFEKLYTLAPTDVGAKFLTPEAGGHAFLQFDDEAQEFFQEWLTELETDLRSDRFHSTAMESHLSKYRSLMPSLSLIFHLLERASNESSSESIELRTAQLAAAWCSFLEKHAERLYQMVSLSEFDAAREILKRIANGNLRSEFTARDVYTKGWKNLSDRGRVQKALEILAEHRHLDAVTVQTGGRAKHVFIVNPDPKR